MRSIIVLLLLALYVSAAYNNTLAEELSRGFMYDVAGDFYDGDGENKDQAYFTSPSAVAYDSTRNLMYVADSSTKVIRMIDMATNIVTTVAGMNTGLPVSMSQIFATGMLLN
jgi:DNA-binding beta-propeller fold protein YncE